MQTLSFGILLTVICSCANGKENVYTGSTPLDRPVRIFLGISLTDSIDFGRWVLTISPGRYELVCRYGIAKPGTPGFRDEKKVAFSGNLRKENNYYYLVHENRNYILLEINANQLYLLDDQKQMLIGNGGYSYTLNNTNPVRSDQFNLRSTDTMVTKIMVFEGRTPCQELSGLLELNRGPACDKLKWYFVFYSDSLTGKPSYYLTGGTAYRKETMNRGVWEIQQGKDGRVIYKLQHEKYTKPIHLLKGGDNILFFVDPEGNLLTGNENFSYTLNRRRQEYPRIER